MSFATNRHSSAPSVRLYCALTVLCTLAAAPARGADGSIPKIRSLLFEQTSAGINWHPSSSEHRVAYVSGYQNLPPPKRASECETAGEVWTITTRQTPDGAIHDVPIPAEEEFLSPRPQRFEIRVDSTLHVFERAADPQSADAIRVTLATTGRDVTTGQRRAEVESMLVVLRSALAEGDAEKIRAAASAVQKRAAELGFVINNRENEGAKVTIDVGGVVARLPGVDPRTAEGQDMIEYALGLTLRRTPAAGGATYVMVGKQTERERVDGAVRAELADKLSFSGAPVNMKTASVVLMVLDFEVVPGKDPKSYDYEARQPYVVAMIVPHDANGDRLYKLGKKFESGSNNDRGDLESQVNKLFAADRDGRFMFPVATTVPASCPRLSPQILGHVSMPTTRLKSTPDGMKDRLQGFADAEELKIIIEEMVHATTQVSTPSVGTSLQRPELARTISALQAKNSARAATMLRLLGAEGTENSPTSEAEQQLPVKGKSKWMGYNVLLDPTGRVYSGRQRHHRTLYQFLVLGKGPWISKHGASDETRIAADYLDGLARNAGFRTPEDFRAALDRFTAEALAKMTTDEVSNDRWTVAERHLGERLAKALGITDVSPEAISQKIEAIGVAVTTSP